MSIPRIRISHTVKELLSFICNVICCKDRKDSEELIEKFECEFAACYGFKRGVAVSRARIALFLLLKTLPLKKGSEVIISAIHVADFVNMIRLAGFVPIVADLQQDRYCIDYDDLESKINERTALFIVTHLSGYATDMGRIQQISENSNVPFVEDCSQVYKAYFDGKRLGTFGVASIFSMGLAKSVCTVLGGMILCSDENLLREIQGKVKPFDSPSIMMLVPEAIKNLVVNIATTQVVFKWLTFPLISLMASGGDFFSQFQKANKTVALREGMPPQFLTRFCWQQAIMGLSQLATLDEREQRRVDAGNYLYQRLDSKEKVIVPEAEEGSKNSFWLFPVIAEDSAGLKKFLLSRGIDSSSMLLTCLAEEPEFADLHFSASKAGELRRHTLFLPMYSDISQAEIGRIADAIEFYLSSKGSR